jgi:hypothetical protein
MSPFLELFWRSQFVRTWLLPPTAISGTTDIHKKNRYLTHRIYVLYTFSQIPHHFPATWEGKISSPSSTRHRRPTITSAQPCVNQVTRSILCYFQKVEYCFFFILLLFILWPSRHGSVRFDGHCPSNQITFESTRSLRISTEFSFPFRITQTAFHYLLH